MKKQEGGFKQRLKAIRYLALAVMLACGLCPVGAIPALGEGSSSLEEIINSGERTFYPATSSNAGNNDYNRWASVVNSYLTIDDLGYLERVEYINDQLRVELYEIGESDYRLVFSGIIDPEAYTPSTMAEGNSLLWGGFYSGSEYNYVVTGQNNYDEDDSLPVVRITQVSKDWEEVVNYVELTGINTRIPFRSGSLRMLEYDGSLYLRTSHSMYFTSDGLSHQANMTFQFDAASLEVLGSAYQVAFSRYGYASHSFNQFLTVLGGSVYALDHGDAYPRSLVVKNFDGSSADIFEISGTTGDNYTGVTVGGFSSSETSGTLLAAFSSYDQETHATGTKNIYLTITTADLRSTETIMFTNNTGSNNYVSVGNPQLVKFDDDTFALMWEYGTDDEIAYVFIDGEGNQLSEIQYAEAQLSDCQPILIRDGVALWYVTGSGSTATVPTFYELDANTGELTALSETSILRLAGKNRYETMGAIVADVYESADTVILARGDAFPDALAASGLAGALGGVPVVLTASSSLSDSATELIETLSPSKVIVLGDSNSISNTVIAELKKLGVTETTRYGGVNRFETANQIYLENQNLFGRTAIVTSGETYADALSIAPYAYQLAAPIFLTNSSGSLNAQSLAQLTTENFDRVIVLGGTDRVSAQQRSVLSARFGSGYIELGANSASRYLTSAEIIAWADSESLVDWDSLYLTTGENFADALAAGAPAGEQGSAILLVSPSLSADSSAELVNLILEHGDVIRRVCILGDTNTLPSSVWNLVSATLLELDWNAH